MSWGQKSRGQRLQGQKSRGQSLRGQRSRGQGLQALKSEIVQLQLTVRCQPNHPNSGFEESNELFKSYRVLPQIICFFFGS